ncbi:NapH/MauN family ferredoxin-type protein [Nitrosophilus alvini]|uniref:NapH/MauN family ferredoxin-type protein n=1 Tax=Nitrosophilus alvini TaxID=2714855 RepID=UPI00190BF3A7|nr:NapH/MauN family ferredoxin-type protein [Nitrosophilus alvini]
MDRYNWSVKELVNAPLLSTLYYKTKEGKIRPSYRAVRWFVVFLINLAFFLSYYLDIQFLEGTLSGSRLLGFHLIDPFVALEILAAEHHIHTNIIIGTLTIVFFYFFAGGKSFCAWVCPYGLISEIGERIHQILVNRHIIKERKFDPRVRYIFWAIFLVMAAVDGYLVFEVINPVGILSRFFVYGWSLAIIWVFVILLFEIFFSRRGWCKYVCPVGTTYNFIGWTSATKVQWDMDKCDHCMACFAVCPEDHVLEFAKAKYDEDRKKKGITKEFVKNGDCTLCARCFDVCHTDAYNFEFRLKNLI